MIWEFEGQLGDGKTIGAVALAKRKHDSNRVVYGNLGIGGWSRDIDNILAVKDLHNCVAVLDDLIAWLDSRKSMKDSWATWILQRSRKMDVDIIYTQQLDTGVDVRLRAVTNVRVKTYCVRFPVFRWDFCDLNDRVYKRRRVRFSESVYELYKTREVVVQDIDLAFVQRLFLDVPKKSAFSHLLNSKYNIGVTVGACIFELLELGAVHRLSELLESHGFQVVGAVSASGVAQSDTSVTASDAWFSRLGGN